MAKNVELLADKVGRLSPAAKFIMASQLVQKAPDVAIAIAQQAIDELELVRLFKQK